MAQDRVSAVQLLEFNIKFKSVRRLHRQAANKQKMFWKAVVDKQLVDPNARIEFLVGYKNGVDALVLKYCFDATTTGRSKKCSA